MTPYARIDYRSGADFILSHDLREPEDDKPLTMVMSLDGTYRQPWYLGPQRRTRIFRYAGFVVCSSDEDAYAHWQRENAILDGCFDYSDEGKYSGKAYRDGPWESRLLWQSNLTGYAHTEGVFTYAEVSSAMGASSSTLGMRVDYSDILRSDIGKVAKSTDKHNAQVKQKSKERFRRLGRG